MKKIFLFLSIISLFLILGRPGEALAVCPGTCTPGTDWTTTWSDSVSTWSDSTPHTETTYSITAPCKVFFDTDFDILIEVDDNESFNASANDVAFLWSLTDEPITSGGSDTLLSGFWLDLETDTDSSGYYDHWERTYTQRYTVIVEDHNILFNFTDQGPRGGFHNTSAQVLGCVTVDPLPPTSNEPPVVDAGADRVITSEEQLTTVLLGSATDADGDLLDYRWLEGGIEIQAGAPVGASGEAPLNLGLLLPFSLGGHTLTLEVSDATIAVSDTVVLSIENSPPTAVLSGAGTYQIFDDLVLGGTVSDYDGDTLTYTWTDDLSGVLASGSVSTVQGGAPVTLPASVITEGLSLGTHSVTLTLSDSVNTVSSSIGVEVVDTEAPTLAPVAAPNMLWPPNDNMIPVRVTVNVADNSGEQISFTVAMTSNEAQGAEVDYSIENIDQAAGIVDLLLRAKRSGVALGREYTVTVTATDSSLNSSSASVVILVPHDKRKK